MRLICRSWEGQTMAKGAENDGGTRRQSVLPVVFFSAVVIDQRGQRSMGAKECQILMTTDP